MKTKTLDVVCKDDKQIERLARFKEEDSDALDRILNTGYNEGVDDGKISGMVIGGLTLITVAGVCKILNLFGKR